MWFRGATETITITLPFQVDQLASGFVTIAQLGRNIIDKPLDECELEGSVIKARLTQEEALKLIAGTEAEIQFVGRTHAGDVIPSTIYRGTPEKLLHSGVI